MYIVTEKPELDPQDPEDDDFLEEIKWPLHEDFDYEDFYGEDEDIEENTNYDD